MHRAHERGRLVLLAEHREEVRQVVRRLVVVGILPQAQLAHLAHLVDLLLVGASFEGRGSGQQLPQALEQSLAAAVEVRQGRDVERREGVVPRRAFCEAVAPRLRRLLLERAVLSSVAHEVLPLVVERGQGSHAADPQRRGVLHVAEAQGCLGTGCIGEGEVERPRAGLAHLHVDRNVALLHVVLQAKLPSGRVFLVRARLEGVLLQRFPGDGVVEAGDVLEDGVGEDDVGERAHHAVPVAGARPFGQPAAGSVGVEPASRGIERRK